MRPTHSYYALTNKLLLRPLALLLLKRVGFRFFPCQSYCQAIEQADQEGHSWVREPSIIMYDSIPIFDARVLDLMVNQCLEIYDLLAFARANLQGYAYTMSGQPASMIETVRLAFVSLEEVLAFSQICTCTYSLLLALLETFASFCHL